jgi:outer membrane protein
MNTVNQSKAAMEANQYGLEFSKNTVMLNIITFYLNVIFNRELVENSRFQLESSQQQLDRTTKLVEAGSLPITNQLELQSQVASNEVQLINNENLLNLAVLNLKQAMLIPASTPIDIIVPNLDNVDVQSVRSKSADQIFETALTTQPEIKNAELNVESSIYGLKAAKGLYQPTLSLNFNINTNWSDQFRRFEEGQTQVIPTGAFVEFNNVQAPVFQEVAVPVEVDFPFWDQYRNNRSTSLALNLTIPIFNRFQTKAQEQRAQINLQRAELSEIEQRNTLRQTIETAYNDAAAAAKTFEASQRQVEALEETFRVIENQYNIGAANFVEYQVASNNLFQARSDLLRFKYDFVFRMKILEFYEGKPITFEQ